MRKQTLTEAHKWLSETLVQMHSFLKVFTANYLINGFMQHRHEEDGTSQDKEKMRTLGTSRLPSDETSSVGKSRALKGRVTQEYYQARVFTALFTASGLPLPVEKPRVPSGMRGPGGGFPTISEARCRLD